MPTGTKNSQRCTWRHRGRARRRGRLSSGWGWRRLFTRFGLLLARLLLDGKADQPAHVVRQGGVGKGLRLRVLRDGDDRLFLLVVLVRGKGSDFLFRHLIDVLGVGCGPRRRRSEEHTSELQ